MHSAGASWQSSSEAVAIGEQPSEVYARVIVSSAAQIPQARAKLPLFYEICMALSFEPDDKHRCLI